MTWSPVLRMTFPSTAYRDRPRPPVRAIRNEPPRFNRSPDLSHPIPRHAFLLATRKPGRGRNCLTMARPRSPRRFGELNAAWARARGRNHDQIKTPHLMIRGPACSQPHHSACAVPGGSETASLQADRRVLNATASTDDHQDRDVRWRHMGRERAARVIPPSRSTKEVGRPWAALRRPRALQMAASEGIRLHARPSDVPMVVRSGERGVHSGYRCRRTAESHTLVLQ